MTTEKVVRHYGQDSPSDQLRTIVGAIEGSLGNLQEGVGNPDEAVRQIRLMLDSLRGLVPHISDVEWKQDRTWKSDR